MSNRRNFQATQYAFAAHIRNPELNPTPADIEDRRMGIYRELFFNNVKGFLNSSFPVLRSLYSDEQWGEMARRFYALHRCQTPYFLEISREFVDYLQSEHEMRECDPPFLFELAHYEWSELALSISEQEVDRSEVDVNGDLVNGHPVLSPLAWLLTYHYPVHHISKEFQPKQPPETPSCIVAYRDDDDEVRFTEVNAITAKLLQLIDNNKEITGLSALEQMADELPGVARDSVINGGKKILHDLHQQGILSGTAR
jgi:hypothetical protein